MRSEKRAERGIASPQVGKGGCGACHRIGAVGPRFAPDLSDIGAVRPAAALLRSVRDPSSQMMPINRPVRAVTRDGRTINGRRLNEDTYTVQLIDDHEHLVSLVKSELREYTILTSSPMPSFGARLTAGRSAERPPRKESKPRAKARR